jgi:hypothetical protein
MTIVLETNTIQQIPVLTIAPGNAQHCPAVFFIPGYPAGHEVTPQMEADAVDWLEQFPGPRR